MARQARHCAWLGVSQSDQVAIGHSDQRQQWRLQLGLGRSRPCEPDHFHSVDLLGIVRPRRMPRGPRKGSGPSSELVGCLRTSRASTRDAYGRSILDEVKQDSAAYARVVQTLRRRLLKSVIPEVAGGFVRYPGLKARAASETDETLGEIVRASLGLLRGCWCFSPSITICFRCAIPSTVARA